MRHADNGNVFQADETVVMSGIVRWLPKIIAIGVVGGFFTLAWYAYHTGSQSYKEDELMVVEADKTPMKEKPLDPGGMKFPNQDKTVYDTFSGNSQAAAKVERVLPPPEEPLPKQGEDSETTTWINDKLHAKDQGKQEQVIGEDGAVKATSAIKEVPVDAFKKPKPVNQQVAEMLLPGAKDKLVSSADKIDVKKESPAVAAAEQAVKIVSAKDAPAADATAVQPKVIKVADETPPAAPAVKPAASTGSAKAQLGAYRSEREANDAFGKMQQKFPELSGKSPSIVKADLGAKGIYYRLRVGGMSAGDAKALCDALAAKKQPCLVAKD